MEIFCNFINIFTGTFDQFNVSLMNKSINFFIKKNLTDPRTLTKSLSLYTHTHISVT